MRNTEQKNYHPDATLSSTFGKPLTFLFQKGPHPEGQAGQEPSTSP